MWWERTRKQAMNDIYAQVDQYLEGLFGPGDEVLEAAERRADEAQLPQIQVSASYGRFLHVLALAVNARSVLEVGTLAGYSAIWLARALPEDGRLVSLEHDQTHAEVARSNLEAAGLGDRAQVRVGRAADLLDTMATGGEGPFDMVFIDADKPSYKTYLDQAIALARPGTLIVADNVVRRGKVLESESDDPAVRGTRAFNEAVANDPRVEVAFLQTIGEKNHDGLAMAVVKDLNR